MISGVTEPEDEDVLEEAETIKYCLETLTKKNPLVVKEVSKVKLDSALLLCLSDWRQGSVSDLHRP